MLKDYYGFIFLIILLFCIMCFPLTLVYIKRQCACKNAVVEPFETLQAGDYPSSDERPIMDSYKFSEKKVVDSNNYSSNWWHYPVFSLGSYVQITNNLRYYKSPDNGLCSPAEFCGDFYQDNTIYPKSNIIMPLQPVVNNNGIRVNYYETDKNLFLSAQPGTLVELPAF